MIKKFFEWNIRVCERIESHLPDSFNFSLLYRHARQTAELCGRKQGQIVLDVGGGRSCKYVSYFAEGTSVAIVALDIDQAELAANEHTSLTAVCDATVALPLSAQAVDIVVTSSVLEHLRATDPFVAEAYRVLKPGGVMINVFPCRYAPFSIINRILPERIARKLLYYFFPQWKDACGFKAYYDNCYYSAMKDVMERNGFVVSEMVCRYYQSIYYKFFIPFYLMMLLYDAIISRLDIRNLCCQIMLVANKKA